MNSPVPTLVYHFTSVEHLPGIVAQGLLSDSIAQTLPSFTVEVGNQGIKERRRNRTVDVGPGGVVSDYVPFYFAPRSPMLYSIHRGNVPTYQDGCDRLIYLVSSVQMLQQRGLTVLYTDRNAVLDYAKFSANAVDVDGLVDWSLMQQQYWNNTDAEPDRVERRMAECLVHQAVPWDAFLGVAAGNSACQTEAAALLASAGVAANVFVRPGWYF